MLSSDVNVIRERMARIRTRARGKAHRLSNETRRFFDWRNSVRLFPWGMLCLAAAAGYWIVPPRTRVSVKPQVVVPPPEPPPQRPGLLSSALRMGGGLLFRLALSQLGKKAGDVFAHAMSEPSSTQHHKESFHESRDRLAARR